MQFLIAIVEHSTSVMPMDTSSLKLILLPMFWSTSHHYLYSIISQDQLILRIYFLPTATNISKVLFLSQSNPLLSNSQSIIMLILSHSSHKEFASNSSSKHLQQCKQFQLLMLTFQKLVSLMMEMVIQTLPQLIIITNLVQFSDKLQLSLKKTQSISVSTAHLLHKSQPQYWSLTTPSLITQPLLNQPFHSQSKRRSLKIQQIWWF